MTRAATPDRGDAGPTVYRIDESGKLIDVNPAWDEFASANDGEEVRSERVLGASLWSHIADPAVRQLYEHFVAAARAGKTITFPFRCDGPAVRRLLLMTIRSPDGKSVEFSSTLKERTGRPPIRLLDRRLPRTRDILRLCGWCHRVSVQPGRWMDLERAVAHRSPFLKPQLPTLTHGICDHCRDALLAQLKRQTN